MGGVSFFPDTGGCIIFDRFAGGGIVASGDVTEPNFGEIGQLRHGANSGARSFDRVRLLDRDRRPNIFNGIDLWFIEKIEKLAGVGRECFDVTALTLGVKGIKNER